MLGLCDALVATLLFQVSFMYSVHKSACHVCPSHFNNKSWIYHNCYTMCRLLMLMKIALITELFLTNTALVSCKD